MTCVDEEDAHFMGQALLEARSAFELGEVPVGAVLVREGQILARSHNLVETRSDATAHAEILCLQAGAHLLQNWRLLQTTLYCTLEPCAMCAGAMLLSRITRLVYGAPDLRHGVHGSWCQLFANPHPTHTIQISKGVLEGESAALMRSFFYARRKN